MGWLRRTIIVAVIATGYVLAFVVLHPRIGDPVVSLAALPILAAAWMFGFARGVIVTVVVVATTIALMQTIGGHDGFQTPQLARISVAIVLGAVVGWASDLTRRQRGLIDQNRRIDAALRASQQGLERAVAERTAELIHANEALTIESAARREAEARATTADRMAVIGTLTTGISHEINNPLAVIITNLDFLSETLGASDPRLTEAIADAQSAALRAAEIVQHMRVFIQSNSSADVADVKRVVDATVRLVANKIRHRARLELDIESTPPVALSDAHLGQVLLNLLVNASQALPQRSAPDNLVRVRVRRVGDADRVRFEVTDTGSGIPADVVQHLFEPFFTTKPLGEGTGLGLWMCHQIVTAAGGQITVESSPGQGTTFRIELPTATADDDHVIAPPRATARRVRLLAIDDDAAVGRSIGRLIGDRHDVVVVDDARRALADIEAGQRFDVILCDVMMPTMNGVEFFARLQALAPDQAERVVFMTGGAFTGQEHDFMRDPSRRRLDKPFVAESLESAIHQVTIDTQGGRAEGAAQL